MIRKLLSILGSRSGRRLPEAARAERQRDRQGLRSHDPGVEASVEAAIQWLLAAQENSASRDGGVARHYSLIDSWGSSYPETTGYIVPTLIRWGELEGDEHVLASARKMTDWLVSIQFSNGGFQGGVVGAEPLVPVTFNTGQILIGLAAAARKWGEPYRSAMNRAARWLVETQDSDGCWRRHPTPFAKPGEKAYETHVSWGLFEAARVEPNEVYQEAALANVRWAISLQRDNGWVDKCCLTDPRAPLTHTLGYYLRGVLEAYRFASDSTLLEAADKTGIGLLEACAEDGFLAGRLDENWRGTVPWACLTGSVQIAHCFLFLFQETKNASFRDTAFALNRYVRRTVRLNESSGIRGGIKGSFPVWGDYGHYEYLNWAAKFFIDANLLEADVRRAS